MSLYRRILVATDFSEISDNARAWAAELASRHGAELHLLHINPLEPDAETYGDGVAAHIRALADASRKALEEQAAIEGVTLVRAVRHDNSPARGVLRYAEEEGADLVVLGTQGRSGWKRLTLGSVALKVLHEAEVPVLVVGHGSQHRLGARGLQRILAPVDLSEAARGGLRHAAELARVHGAQLTALHVVAPPSLPPYYPDQVEVHVDMARAHAALREFVEGQDPGEEAGSMRLEVSEGVPQEEIATKVKAQSADLVVLSAFGQSAVSRLVFGSVVDRVVRSAECPVLVYRRPRA